MEEPEKDAVEEPTHTEQDAEEAASFMGRELASIAVVSIGAMLLLALLLMQATGLAEFVGGGLGSGAQWVAVALFAAAVVGVFVWARRSL